MNRFYGNLAYVTCGNGCESKLQKVLYDENGKAVDVDWNSLIEIYNNHNSICTPESLYTNDNNAYYDDPNQCTGFVIENDPSSGYRYCEY